MKEIYQVLAAEMNQELRLTQIANNLANVNTVGFKKDDTLFQSILVSALNKTGAGQDPAAAGGAANSAAEAWPAMTWPALAQSFVNYQEGILQPTGEKLDVAIEGEGFFQIQGDGETLYTRAGNFRLNDNSELVTPSGLRVLSPVGSPITLNLTDGPPQINAEGEIKVKGSTVDRLGVVRFADPQRLEKHGEGLFRALQGAGAESMDRPGLRQGMIEGSNVNVIGEMVRMIETQRATAVQQKVIQTLDDLTARRIEAAR